MMYGINFGCPDLPPGIARKFVKKVPARKNGKGRTIWWARLVGLCQTEEELRLMKIQADNGRRFITVLKRRGADGWWYGVYCD